MTPNNEIAIRPSQAPATSEPPAVPVIANDIIRPRLPEVGRIRCGEKETKLVTKGGKQVEVTYPKKLNVFRFTSRDRSLIERVAELYGGEVKPWASDEGPQWQVVSTSNAIAVIVPTADLSFSQYFELWDGGGCQRRCDGHYEMLGDRQCVCIPAERAAGKEGSCKPTTRLAVFLPGIKGLGVWRLETHGKNAGAELRGSVSMIAAYGASLTRATLTTAIRPGRVRKPDGSYTPVRYVVPTLMADDDIAEWVDRAQLETATPQGVLPASHEYLDPRDEKMLELHAAWNKAVGKKPSDVSAEDWRAARLDWSEAILGREILSWNGPGYEETLTRADVQTLLDAFGPLEDLQTAPDSSLDEGAQAGPRPRFGDSINPAWGKRPADSSAGPENKDRGASRLHGGTDSDPAPAEPLSVGEEGTGEPAKQREATSPAEHTPDEGDEEAPDSAAGEAREARGREAAAPPEPTPAQEVAAGAGDTRMNAPGVRSQVPTGSPARSGSSATGPAATPKPRRKPPAPSVAQVREAQQDAEATRKQTTVERPPSAWLLTLRPRAARLIIDRFSNHMKPGQKAEDFVAKWVADHPNVVPPLETWQRADDWPNETINALVADLPPKEV